ncbi:MAG: GntR family transcriptional regulator [Lachnospiraceae bacterium]|nr:GntR family transcriptional regulator [Lachnospiraceae bacterium]
MAWSLNADRPIYSQIVERLETQIVSGQYKPGDKLPSVRELAAEAGVNPNTMQKAFADLERSGLIITQRTSGRTVTEDVAMIQQIQKSLATEQILSFFERMEELGYDKENTLKLMELISKEAK